tara:strand:- start:194 stop:370 length:177 start_codon:yes stop_codon:yes gene_type:complete
MKEVFLVIKIKKNLGFFKASLSGYVFCKYSFVVMQEKKDCAIFGTIVTIKEYKGTLSD